MKCNYTYIPEIQPGGPRVILHLHNLVNIVLTLNGQQHVDIQTRHEYMLAIANSTRYATHFVYMWSKSSIISNIFFRDYAFIALEPKWSNAYNQFYRSLLKCLLQHIILL